MEVLTVVKMPIKEHEGILAFITNLPIQNSPPLAPIPRHQCEFNLSFLDALKLVSIKNRKHNYLVRTNIDG